MTRNQFRFLMAAGLCLAMSLAACADFGKGNETSNQPPVMVTEELQYQILDGIVYLHLQDQTIECGPVGAMHDCLPSQGFEPIVVEDLDIGKVVSALTLDSIDLKQDCVGNCAPIEATWCGNAKNPDGTPYDNKWSCLPVILADGCHMKAVATPCTDPNKECRLEGDYPTWGVCKLIPTCQTAADCTGTDQCLTATCDINHQCVYTKHLGETCSDGLACTSGDVCIFKGPTSSEIVCKGADIVCDDQNPCTTDYCEAASGLCKTLLVGDGTACSDKNQCTFGDLCLAGVCKGTVNLCNDGNQCTLDACDPLTGGCIHTNLNDGAGCDDADKCTIGDACLAGVCHGTDKNCDDQNPCTTDSCYSLTGNCTHSNLADNSVCGAKKVCLLGGCLDSSLTCAVKDAKQCVQNNGNEQFQNCTFATGATLGLWTLVQNCGPIGTVPICTVPEGCANCVPTCAGKVCGSDSCLGQCGPGCATGFVCATDQASCVRCNVAADCATGQVCSGNVCVTAPECTTNANCVGVVGKPVCNTTTGKCVECLLDTQCTGQGATHCNTTTDTCVQCLTDAQCGAGQVCALGVCTTPFPGTCQPFTVILSSGTSATTLWFWSANGNLVATGGTVTVTSVGGSFPSPTGACAGTLEYPDRWASWVGGTFPINPLAPTGTCTLTGNATPKAFCVLPKGQAAWGCGWDGVCAKVCTATAQCNPLLQETCVNGYCISG